MKHSRNFFYLVLGMLGTVVSLLLWRAACIGWPGLDVAGGAAAFLVLPWLFVVPHTLAARMPLPLVRMFGRVGGYVFFALYDGLVLLVPFGVLCAVSLAPPLAAMRVPLLRGCVWLEAAVLAVWMAVGIWKGHHHRVRRVTVETTKPIPRPFTVAFASDIHLGVSMGPAVARQFVRDMNALAPDLILFGGDIIDGDLDPVLREKSLQALAGMQAAWGTYAVLGNHDHYGFDVSREKALLEAAGIRVLSGEMREAASGVQVSGWLDALYHTEAENRRALSAGQAAAETSATEQPFQIVIEHEPVRMEQAAHDGADLYFAGHTHAGQFWPNRLLVQRVFPFDYGTRFFGRMTAIVTSGYGAWGGQYRVGPAPEIVVVSVVQKQ
ncbi:MAG: metallophosphoesterase [Veillonellaceae bacterium]|nr:metallophosphoesterase [Veillonellaceae bacterium]